MSRTWFWVIIISVLTLNYGVAEATDQNDATNAATSILQSIHGHQFEKLWNVQTSQWFKEKTTEDSFIANLSLGAQQVGAAQDSKLVDISYSRSDPATGFVGEIYACTYITTYSVGKFYERVVVLKENDGKFRLSGLWGSPASQ